MVESSVRKELRKKGVRPSKRRGQNFLTNDLVANRIASFAALAPATPVLEIGPGLGAITGHIIAQAQTVVAVELESELAVDLERRYPSLRVIQGDIRNIRLGEVFPGECQVVVVGNIPYSISTDVVFWFLRERMRISYASFLFQREFSERLAALPGTKAYSSLTIQREVFATAELGEVIPGSVFEPPAAVESRLIRITPRKVPIVEDSQLERFEQVVRTAFAKRRKTILNALSGSSIFPDKDVLRSYLSKLNIDEQRRPETLAVSEFLALSRYG